jgi:hypothetical protein
MSWLSCASATVYFEASKELSRALIELSRALVERVDELALLRLRDGILRILGS